jgi:hypothetical protein
MSAAQLNIDTSPTARTVAFGLLLAPAEFAPEAVADRLGQSVEYVNQARALLEDDNLTNYEGRPHSGRLFGALASAWCNDQPEIGVRSEPAPGNTNTNEQLCLGLEDVEVTPGWALGGMAAAAAWTVPVHGQPISPRHFYVPNKMYLDAAVGQLGAVLEGEVAKAFVRQDPIAWIARHRFDPTKLTLSNTHWPIVHPLVAALEVAALEVELNLKKSALLNAWVNLPPEVAHRPWR